MSRRSEQVCLASSDLLHTHLALAGMRFDYHCWYYRHEHATLCCEVMSYPHALSVVKAFPHLKHPMVTLVLMQAMV